MSMKEDVEEMKKLVKVAQEEEQNKRERREVARTICIETDMFNSQNDKSSFYFIADASDEPYANVGPMTNSTANMQRTRIGAQNYFSAAPNKIAAYHNDGSNAIFVDGHVAHILYSIHTDQKPPWKVE